MKRLPIWMRGLLYMAMKPRLAAAFLALMVMGYETAVEQNGKSGSTPNG